MSKINILVNPNDRSGSGKYRCIDPHVTLQNNHSEEYFVEINQNIDFNDTNYLKKFNIFFFNRVPGGNYQQAEEIFAKIKSLGGKIVLDLDDYWRLDKSHGMYLQAKEGGYSRTIINLVKSADMVTVTTEILRDEVFKYNKNCFVLPNAINPKEQQFTPKPTESDRLRFGWLGGSSHIKDIELIKDIAQTTAKRKDEIQFVLCGFDKRGKVKMFNPETKKWMERDMQPLETTWFMYEVFITNNFRLLEGDTEYLSHLMKFDPEVKFDDLNKPYRRIWTKNINNYATGYNEFDVALAPLLDNEFNKYKSQLKVIEAGFHKKPIIAQNYGPYTIDLISAVNKGGTINSDGNSLLVETSKNHKQWGKHVKMLMDNPNMVTDLGEKLYETVKDRYDINNVTKYRDELYKSLV